MIAVSFTNHSQKVHFLVAVFINHLIWVSSLSLILVDLSLGS